MEKILALLPPRLAYKAIALYQKQNDLIVFAFRMVLLILLWKTAFYFIWRNPFLLDAYNDMSLIVIDYILYSCAYLLELLQYPIQIDSINRILRIENTLGVTVGEPCIGYELTALFIALIAAHKGGTVKKLWFIPMGVMVIYFLNLIRISALAILVQYNHTIWELNHKLIFTLIIYSVVFIMWKWWLLDKKHQLITVSKRE